MNSSYEPSEQRELCSECGVHEAGAVINGGVYLYTFQPALDQGLCFHCHFWIKQMETRPERAVIVNGVHYRMGEEPSDPRSYRGMLGFGGAEWKIQFKDGREPALVVSHNLWHQGHIPDRFKDRLPDNAEFIPKPELETFPKDYTGVRRIKV